MSTAADIGTVRQPVPAQEGQEGRGGHLWARWRRRFGELGIGAKLLVMILPLIIVPTLVLAAVGFVASSREAAKTSTRYLMQRENDLRVLAENTVVRDFFFNRYYELDEEAEIYRREVERWLLRFARRSNAAEIVYPRVRYVDDTGTEIVTVDGGAEGGGALGEPGAPVAGTAFFKALRAMPPDGVFLSLPAAERMVYAIPIHERHEDGSATFLGGLVLDFVYPLEEFRRTTLVIARTFIAIALAGLLVAVPLTVTQVRRLTHPIRRLSAAADVIAAGDRSVRVDIRSNDEIGRLADSFNKMARSLADQEERLRRRGDEHRALFEIGQEITAQIDLEPTLHLIVARAKKLLRGDLGLLALHEEGDGFVVRAHSGDDDAAKRLAGLRFQAGEGLGGHVVRDGRALLVGDYLREYPDSPFFARVRDAGLRAIVAVPLRARGDATIGVLYVFSRTPDRFTGEDLELLSALGNQATISIENAKLYAEVSRHAEELELKVAERTRDLQEANLRLQEASGHKSRFLANMSHELRTPLNAIIGFTRLVMRKGQDSLPPRQYENLQKILTSADHLLRLINDVLDLSKIESGRVELHPTRFELRPLVDECLRTVEPMVRGDAVRLVSDVRPGLPPLDTDRDKLKQILINLLSNAVKFTREGGVTLTAAERDGAVAIAVADTGIGIPEDKLAIIFDEFQQLDDSTTRPHGGTGLGLSISRRLARLLGGEIAVESALGRGSTFTVTVPVAGEVMAGRPPDPGFEQAAGQSDVRRRATS